MSCGVEVGELGFEVSGNEPTEPLKNMKPAIHQRVCAYGPDLDTILAMGDGLTPLSSSPNPKEAENL